MSNRVVITGLGIVSPNATGTEAFIEAIKKGKSGIRFVRELADLNFSCCIAGIPDVPAELVKKYFTSLQLRNFNSSGILYGCIAGMEAWLDGGMSINNSDEADYDSGLIMGTGSAGVEKTREAIYKVDGGEVRRLGSNTLTQTMVSGVSAYLGGMLGLGNQVTTNSAACSTGTEAVLMAYERIKSGRAVRMIAGSTCDHGPYVWAGFDAIRVMTYKFNDFPEKGSRPMSRTASGFVPGSGAGALLLESLDSARQRGARIYAEVLGGEVNSGGQRGDGTMTVQNSAAVQRCIRKAVDTSGIKPQDIDAIDGHLTSTSKDSLEVRNWAEAINRKGEGFPYINSLKSMTGHCLTASGSIECAAAVLELYGQFLYPSINCEDVKPEIAEIISESRIPRELTFPERLNIIAKASLGFGDVNACIIFSRFID
ncbi:MAG TPA: beta-ketoacyl-[acyl-carrier-protein] synthase family protein [Ignavibacteriaceae bacterium]|nr:beta-ketoacyl-[acyl-carrier-protein] synthase family protein [Ignavibacteriaceae bacterium]